ncbi:MAG: hypothetical protein KJN67_02200, partial [Pontiella sp.]|nr:hypothetical protein [Pontiella sp.]
DGTYTYGFYLDQDYKDCFEEMIMAFGNHIRNELSVHLRDTVAWVRVDTAHTGDEAPYEEPQYVADNTPEYVILPEDWLAFRLWAFGVYDQAFQHGGGKKIPLLYSRVKPVDNPVEWVWCATNVTAGLGVKYGGAVRGHHLDQSAEIPASYKHLAVDSDIGLFSRNEMDQTWSKPFFQLNVRLGMYWAAVEQLNAGMSVWDVTQSCLDRTYIDDHMIAFGLFDKWAAELDPETALGGFCIFHEGLDSSDTNKFPEVQYGAVIRSNQDRYAAICASNAAHGAQMDDLYAATRGQVYQRISQTGFNDSGWGIVAGNYDRFITQIDPENTSIGLFRINGPITTNSHPFNRFARGFDSANGKNMMYFDLHDDLLPSAGQRVQLSVIYLDRGTGQFELQYDAAGDSQKTAFAVTKTDTDTWKTNSVIVTDWVFENNGTNGSDLALLNVDSDDDIFHMLELLKLGEVHVGSAGRGTVDARHGLDTLELNTGTAMEGYEYELTAVPEQGWELSGWSGDVTGTTEQVTLFPTRDTRATANFSFTGRFYSEDNFNTVGLSGGTGWSGSWLLSGGQEFYTRGANAVPRLFSNGQITRTLHVPVNNAELRFKWDVDKLDDGDGDYTRAEVFNGSWNTVWEISDSSRNGDLDNGTSPDSMWTEILDVSAYGTITQVRFSGLIEGGESFWVD